MNILVFNECGSDNIGDQAIATGIYDFLTAERHAFNFIHLEKGMPFEMPSHREFGDNLNEYDEDLHNKFFSKLLKKIKDLIYPLYMIFWSARYFYRLLSIIQLIRSSNLVVIGGGSVIMNNKLHFPIALFQIALFCKIVKTDYAFYGISRGGEINGLSKFLLQFSIRNAKKVVVRDVGTKKMLQGWLSSGNVDVAPDCAFLLEKVVVESKGDYVVINIAHNSSGLCEKKYNNYIDFIYELTLRLSITHRVVLCSTGCAEDKPMIINFKNRLATCGVEVNCFFPSSVDGFLDVISKAKLAVGMRLHFYIMSKICKKSTFIVPASPKISGYLHTLRRGEEFISDSLVDDFLASSSSKEELYLTLEKYIDKKDSEVLKLQRLSAENMFRTFLE